MNVWMYEHEGQLTGPVSIEQLRMLFIPRKIDGSTRVSDEGEHSLRSLSQIPWFEDWEREILNRQDLPDPMAVEPAADVWVRILGRLFDILAAAICLLAIEIITAYLLWPQLGLGEDIPWWGQVLYSALIFLPLVILLDALVYRLAGNTPGKWFMGAKVLDRQGRPLTFGAATLRNFGFMTLGLGMCIPILNILP